MKKSWRPLWLRCDLDILLRDSLYFSPINFSATTATIALSTWRTYFRIINQRSTQNLLVKNVLGLLAMDLGMIPGVSIPTFGRFVLTEMECEGEDVRFELIRVKRPLRIREETLKLPLNRIHKLEYLHKGEEGLALVHVIVKQSRTPSREFIVQPHPLWIARTEEINDLIR